MSKKLINLTAHTVKILNKHGDIIEIPPSGNIARVQYDIIVENEINDIPIVKFVYQKDIVGLPKPQKDKLYIVSSVVKNATLDRDDTVAPFSLHKEKGKVVICKGLRLNG